jgi:hypothetical protein
LGATLIYLVTGRHPAELSQGNLQIQFESTVNLNPDLIAWLKWMTQPSLNRRLASAKEALQALENPRQPTDISMVRQKPFGSRIELKKNGENLEVVIPPKKLSFWNFYWILVGTLFCLWMFLYPFTWLNLVIQGHFPFIIGFLVYLPICWIIGLLIGYSVLWECLLTFFRGTRIKIHRQQISVTHLWPWCHNQVAPIKKKSMMQRIMYIRDSRLTYVYNEKYYETMIISHVTPPEIEWLTNEISAISNGKFTFACKKVANMSVNSKITQPK